MNFESSGMKLVKQIEARGNEIGLHGSYNSYDSQERMKQENEKMDNIAARKDYGCRQHYLRFKVSET